MHLDEPGVSHRHPQAASVGRHLRRRQARFDRPALHEPRVRADVGRPRVAAHRAHRARSTKRPARSRRTCSGASSGRRSISFRRRFPTWSPARFSRGWSCCRAARALEASHFPPNEAKVEELNAFRTPGAAADDLRGVLPVSDRPRVAPSRDEHGAEAVRAEGGRSDPRVGREDSPVQADAGAAAGAEGDRRRHAPAAADAPAAAGRCRRGQDDRRAAGGDRRDGERPAGGVHGAHGNPGRAALRQHRAAAVAVALPRGHADRQHAGPQEAHAPRAHRARDDEPDRRHPRAGAGVDHVPQARARGHRRAAPLRRGAARGAPREGAAARRAPDDRHADSAHARPDRLQRARRVEDSGSASRAQAR